MNSSLRKALVLLLLSVTACHAGSIVLGGDDLTDHGGYNPDTGEVTQGWKYISLVLTQLYQDCTLPNHDEVVALVGSAEPDPEGFTNGTLSYDNDAGEAYLRATQDNGLNLAFYNGAEDIGTFFMNVAAGIENPTVIAIAGSDASNDIDADENVVLARSGDTFADYATRGGSLISHSAGDVSNGNDIDVYGWLLGTTGINHANECESTGAYLTEFGQVLFPTLTDDDVNIEAGPCHTHFSEGTDSDFAAFQPLVIDGEGRVYMMISRGAVAERATVRMNCSSSTTESGVWDVFLPHENGTVLFDLGFFVDSGVSGDEFEDFLAAGLSSVASFTDSGCTATRPEVFQASCPADYNIRDMTLCFDDECVNVEDEFNLNGLGCPEPLCPVCENVETHFVCDNMGIVYNSECQLNRFACLFPGQPTELTPCPTPAPPTPLPTAVPTSAPTNAPVPAPTELPDGDAGGIDADATLSTSGGIGGTELTLGGLVGVCLAAAACCFFFLFFALKRKNRMPVPNVLDDDDV